MRIVTLVVAGAFGWFWLASGEPAGPKPSAPVGRARHADLANLGTQIAVAQQTAVEPDSARRRPVMPAPIQRDVTREIEPTSTIELDDDLLEELLALPPGQRSASLETALGRALTIDDRLMLGIDEAMIEPEPSCDLDADIVGHEVIRIESHAPIIDRTSTSHCFTIDADYVVNLPVAGRTFESVLGASAGSQGEATFASGTTIENEYVVVE